MRTRIGAVFGLLLIALASSISLARHRQSAMLPTEPVGLLTVADGLTSPVTLVSAHDGTGRLFVVDQIGLIRILSPHGGLLPQPFLDLRGKIVPLMPGYDERGLLGLAFHPDYARNGRFFIYYNIPLRSGAPTGFDDTARLSEFTVSSDPNQANPNSERVLLEVDKPQFNHNGGTLAFGPDRKLYLSIGDGGNKNDIGLGHTPELGNAQDLTKLLGKILRLDVDRGTPYGIPADNPFADGTNGRAEIFAYGFRNPYRFSFDLGGSHDLLAGDAGQDLWEEIDRVVKGGNYGWHIKEGTHCFNPDDEDEPPPTCPDTGAHGEPLMDPVIEYPNADNPAGGLGVVNVGGYIYRGSLLPQFQGRYLFGDFSRSEIAADGSLFVADPQNTGLWPMSQLRVAGSPDGRLHHFVKGFGQDDAGEVYVLVTDQLGPTGTTGKIMKYVPAFILQVRAALSRSGGIQAAVTVTNAGTLDASNVRIMQAMLGAARATNLPQTIGALPAGSSQTVTLQFPGSAGAAGAQSVLRIQGVSSEGGFGAAFRVTLP